MTENVVLGLLAAAVALVLGTFTFAGWLVSFALRLDAQQTRHRHDLRGEVHEILGKTEEDLTHRIERLENHSLGLRQHRDSSNGE